MTREERLKWLKQIEKDINVCSIESTLADDMKSCAIHSAIEELEQEPIHDILDKIRAEIEKLRFGQPLRKYVVDECLEIIDKYKESEVKE